MDEESIWSHWMTTSRLWGQVRAMNPHIYSSELTTSWLSEGIKIPFGAIKWPHLSSGGKLEQCYHISLALVVGGDEETLIYLLIYTVALRVSFLRPRLNIESWQFSFSRCLVGVFVPRLSLQGYLCTSPSSRSCCPSSCPSCRYGRFLGEHYLFIGDTFSFGAKWKSF